MAKKKRPKTTDLEATIRFWLEDATHQRGLSLYELAREAGITPGQLSRFARHQRSLSLETASKLCEVLGLYLVDRDLVDSLRRSSEE